MKTKNMSNETKDQSFGMKQHPLRQLFIDQLADLYSAENQLLKALPKMSKAANSSELKSAFDEHLQVTQEHASRLERIFAELDEKPPRHKCKGMEGVIEEGAETIKKKEDEVIKDADLIAAAQRVEHYEIAGYGTVRTFAEKLGMEEAAKLLQQTLEEEGEADKTLTAISEKLLSEQDFETGSVSEESELEGVEESSETEEDTDSDEDMPESERNIR